ncbi:MAG: hypothetical protein KDC38_04345 [Planctomycetes bacterium]|nr:hypothetical protein [Planctomycetota bacterium]
MLDGLFPRPARDFPGRRLLRLLLRSIHIVAAALFTGSIAFDQPTNLVEGWAWGTAATGFVLFGTDLWASCAVLLEVRGVVVASKTLLLGGIVVLIGGEAESRDVPVALAATAIVIGTISSHMAGRFRHRVLAFRELIEPDRRKG